MAGCAWRFVICISVLKSLMPQPSALHRFAHSATPTTRDAARLQAHLLGHRQQPWGADTQDLRAAQVLERHRRAALRKVLRGGAALRRVFHRHIEPNPRHFARHGALERRLGAAGAKVAFVHAAAAVGDGEAKLWMPAGSAKDKNEDWGATIAVGGVPPRGLKAVTTPLLNLSSLLLAVGARSRAASGRVVLNGEANSVIAPIWRNAEAPSDVLLPTGAAAVHVVVRCSRLGYHVSKLASDRSSSHKGSDEQLLLRSGRSASADHR